MAFRFRKNESIPDGLRRIVRERIDEAIAALQSTDEPVESVHKARKRFKEIRSVLKMTRTILGTTYEYENIWYRDAGHSLAAPRESQVALTTWEGLIRDFPDLKKTPEMARFRNQLALRLRALGERANSVAEESKQTLLDSLPHASERVEGWPLAKGEFQDLAAGIHRTYQQGRQARRNACNSGDDALWHEWRKRTQDIWHQIKLLGPISPKGMREKENKLMRISDLLGDDHDLIVFRAFLGRHSALFETWNLRAQLYERIMVRQHQLRNRAYRQGREFWADKPKRFTQKVEDRWKAWRKE